MGARINDTGIRKGPWSAEEDEVLINFVKQNGPRDWSSIRSKGLLPRTGKSCRLRWVNKLRPNLKVGCKFTAEEERIVVELQARIGNKWAAIASHLQGRTDNDVKNFWSSRRKRLARMLHSSSQPHSKYQKQSKQKLVQPTQVPFNFEVAESSNSLIQVKNPSLADCTCDSLFTPLNTELAAPAQLTYCTNDQLMSPMPLREAPMSDSLWFTKLPNVAPLSEASSLLVPYTTVLPDNQARDMGNVYAHQPTSYPEFFPSTNASYQFHENVDDVALEEPFFRGLMEGSCSKSCLQGDNLGNPDGFFDDFPTDVFDSLDPLPVSTVPFPRN